jgi:predicted enzyme related to lactoylglutathione lyase
MTKADKVTWFELPADDTARAGAFYGQVFGWSTSEMGGGSLSVQTAPSDENMNPLEPGAINGDISPRSDGFDRPLIVITVEDIDAKIEMVKNAGGKVVLPRRDITEMGIAWAIISDTEGNRVGVLQNLL